MTARNRFATFFGLAGTLALLAGCGGGGEPAMEHPSAAPPSGTTAPPGGPLTPAPGGQVITVEMVTDDQGNNRFAPSDIKAHVGDVLRFTLVSGVHNVHFLADSNAAATGLPAASPMLQLPGQTFDVSVNFKEGRYYFQCDPHALLGMVGHVKVEERD
jgi:plastocyanin